MNVIKDKYPIHKTMEILYDELTNNKNITRFKLFLNNETLFYTTIAINSIKFCNGYLDINYEQLTPAKTCRAIIRYKDIVGFDIGY